MPPPRSQPPPRRIAGLRRVAAVIALGALLAAEDPFLPPPPPVVVPPPVEDPVEDPIIIPEALILRNGLMELENVGGVVEPPEMAPPHAPAKPGALVLRWDRYRTLVAIDTSAGLVKPCWVVTFSTMPEQVPTPRGPVTLARGQVVVAYRAQAYVDKDRNLIIDARRARLSGTMADNWSPDSFSITPGKEVSSRDDDPTHPSNAGEVEKEVAADAQREEYRRLMFTAQTLVEGTL